MLRRLASTLVLAAGCSAPPARLQGEVGRQDSGLSVAPEVSVDPPLTLPRSVVVQSADVAGDAAGILVVWSSPLEVRAGRVAPDGTPLDPVGIVVAQTPGVTIDRAAVGFDGSGWVVAWMQRVPAGIGFASSVRFRRVQADGSLTAEDGLAVSGGSQVDVASTSGGTSLIAWATGGIVVDAAGTIVAGPTPELGGAVGSDGTGFFVVHTDLHDLVGRFVAADGSAGPAIAVGSTGSGINVGGGVAMGGAVALATWLQLLPDGSAEVRGTRVDPGGTVLDAPALLLATGAANLTPAVTWDGGAFAVAWREADTLEVGAVPAAGPITAVPFAVTGSLEFGGNGFAIGGAGAGLSFVVWNERAETGTPVPTLRGSRLDGATVVDVPGIVLRVGASVQQAPAIACGAAGCLVAWFEPQRPPSLWGARLGIDGAVLSPASFPILDDNTYADGSPHVAAGAGDFLVTYTCGIRVCAARVADDGTVLDAGHEIAEQDNIFARPSPGFVAYSAAAAVYLVAWRRAYLNSGGGSTIAVAVELVDASGAAVPGSRRLLSALDGSAWVNAVAFDGSSFIVAWQQAGPPTYVASARVARVAADATLLDPIGGVPLTAGATASSEPTLASGDALTVAGWTDGRGPVRFATRLAGSAPVDASGLVVSAPAPQGAGLALAADGPFALALWPAVAGGLRASWVDAGGDVLHAEGVVVDARPPLGWAAAADGAGHAVVVYARYEPGLVDAERVYVRAVGFGHGTPCAGDPDCGAGWCVDGMCCDEPCGAGDPSDCLACSIAAGGEENGACTAVRTLPACLADGDPCDDGDPCSVGDSVQGGACVGGPRFACTAYDGCHTAGACDPTTGRCPTAPDGTTCNDGRRCTSGETCSGGVCGGGAECDFELPCRTQVGCDPVADQCFMPFLPTGTPCEVDGDLCSLGETCHLGVCRPPTGAVRCTPLDACHDAGACDPSTGACSSSPLPDGTPCGAGACRGGTCLLPGDGGGGDAAGGEGGDAAGADGGDAAGADGGDAALEADAGRDAGPWDLDGAAEPDGGDAAPGGEPRPGDGDRGPTDPDLAADPVGPLADGSGSDASGPGADPDGAADSAAGGSGGDADRGGVATPRGCGCYGIDGSPAAWVIAWVAWARARRRRGARGAIRAAGAGR